MSLLVHAHACMYDGCSCLCSHCGSSQGPLRRFLRGGRALTTVFGSAPCASRDPRPACGLRARSASGLSFAEAGVPSEPAGYENGRPQAFFCLFTMAGQSCPGLDDVLCEGVMWQCAMYNEAWKSIVLEEASSVYGVHEPSAAEKAELMAAGSCIFDVTVDIADGSDTHVLGRFDVVVDGVGHKFLENDRGAQPRVAVISITHPDVDSVALANIVSLNTRARGGTQGVLELDLSAADVSAVLDVTGVVRVDMQLNLVSLWRQYAALDDFCAQKAHVPEPTRLQYLVCGRVGSTVERRQVNEHDVSYPGKLAAIDEALGGREPLNQSQRQAVEATLRHTVTLIQGPPGSGKTSVVSRIIAVHSRTRGDASGSPVLVAAPSNAGADNALQRHVLMPEAFVGRYGNVETIDPASREHSLQVYSEETEGTAVNRKAKQRRRKAMMERALQNSAVFGTLEKAADLHHNDCRPLVARMVVIDEAAQATEPLCLIPMSYLAVQGHTALVGDHMQLPPTVTCHAVKDKGLERSMFERLFHDGGCHTIVLAEQYRMRQQLWSWPNDAFYMGGVATGMSAERREPVQGLPWDTPLAFVDVRGREQRPRNGKSYRNECEAELAVRLAWP